MDVSGVKNVFLLFLRWMFQVSRIGRVFEVDVSGKCVGRVSEVFQVSMREVFEVDVSSKCVFEVDVSSKYAGRVFEVDVSGK